MQFPTLRACEGLSYLAAKSNSSPKPARQWTFSETVELVDRPIAPDYNGREYAVIDLGDKGVHTYRLESAPHHSKVAMDSGKLT